MSGNANNLPVIVVADFDASQFSPVILDSVGDGSVGSSAIDDDGDIVCVYNDLEDGKCVYGKIGNIISNLDPTKVLGVANDSAGVVTLIGVVRSGSGLTPNQKVYVSQKGVISNTTSFEDVEIGKAISSTNYILS